jgi:PST family polysaccharide transporter
MKSFQRIKNLNRNKDVKNLIGNFASLSLLKLTGFIFPLITIPYLAKVIGVEKFGNIAFAASIVVFFQTIVDFGFDYTGVRDMARIRDDIKKVSFIYSNIIISRFLLMGFGFIILLISVYTIPLFTENRVIILLTYLYIPGYILFPEWFFQAMEEMKFITIINIISKLVFTILVFILIKDKRDYIFQPILVALGYLVSGVIAFVIIRKKYKVRFLLPSFKNILDTLRSSWNMFITLFLPNLYTNFSIILLRNYGGDVATGIYTSGFKFIDLINQISLVLSRTFYPFLARRIDKHNFYIKLSASISILAGFCLFFGADLIIKIFYTEEFIDSAQVLRIMSVSPFFFYLMNTFGPNYLVLIGKEKILRNIVMISSILGFIVSLVMVAKFNFIGVAVTITLTWGFRGLLTWFYANRFKNKNK